jgi:hypothetical protein
MKLFTRTVFICLLSTLPLVGCADSEQADEAEENQPMKTKNGSTDAPKQQSTKLSNPEVSTAQGNASKPISESGGSAKEKNDGELYEVPNRFPLKEKEEQERLEALKKQQPLKEKAEREAKSDTDTDKVTGTGSEEQSNDEDTKEKEKEPPK